LCCAVGRVAQSGRHSPMPSIATTTFCTRRMYVLACTTRSTLHVQNANCEQRAWHGAATIRRKKAECIPRINVEKHSRK
jgi:hypothetical protein